MTLEEMKKKKAELDAKIKEKELAEKKRLREEQIKKNAMKRKIESRVKYIIGGLELAEMKKNNDARIKNLLQNPNLRPQDLKTLKKYFDA